MKPLDERLLADALAYAGEWVEFRQRTLEVPGVAVAVGLRGKLLLSRTFGISDLGRGTPLEAGHAFRIASHSKTFTATAVLQLVEQGRLRLDDRAGQWLAWLPAAPGQLGAATVRALLGHGAGVTRDGDDGGFWEFQRDFPSAADLRAWLGASLPVLAANERFKYSNFGYSLLGMIVEAASGTPYNDYVRAHVVDRLGLERTGPEPDGATREHLAGGYSSRRYGLERVRLPHLDTRAMSPATGFYATAEDLCRYGAAHVLGNEELLSDESKRQMHQQQWKVEGEDEGYGLGFSITEVGERRLVGHGGGFPGFITATRIDPAGGLVVVVLTNAIDGPAKELANGIVALVNRAQEAPAAPGGPPEVDRDRFAGRFFGLWGVTDVARFGGELVALNPELPSPAAKVTRLRVDGADTLTIVETSGYGSAGEQVRYRFDDAGRPASVRFAALEMLPWDAFRDRVMAPLAGGGGRGRDA